MLKTFRKHQNAIRANTVNEDVQALDSPIMDEDNQYQIWCDSGSDYELVGKDCGD